MFRKVCIALICLSLFFLLFLIKTPAQEFSSSAVVDYFDDQIRVEFEVHRKDKKNLNQIARNLGAMTLSESLTFDASKSLVNLVANLNLAPVQIASSVNQVDFRASGSFGEVGPFSSKYLNSETYFLAKGRLVDNLKSPYPQLLTQLKNKAISLTRFENQPALVVTGQVANKAKYELSLDGLKRKKATDLAEKGALVYSEFDLEGYQGISLGAVGSPSLNFINKDGLIIGSDNLNLLKSLLGNQVSKIEEEAEFGNAFRASKSLKTENFDVFYIDMQTLSQTEPDKSRQLVKSFLDFEVTDEFKAQINYANLKSVTLFWTDKELRGTLKVK